MQCTSDGFAEVSRYFCGNTVHGSNGVLRRAFGKRVDLIRLDVSDAIHFAGYNLPCRSLGKVEQGTDPFGGRGMAAKQAH